MRRPRTTANVPINRLTPNASCPSVKGGLLTGCDAFFGQPFDPRIHVDLAGACARNHMRAVPSAFTHLVQAFAFVGETQTTFVRIGSKR
jgi:hypothetical protein